MRPLPLQSNEMRSALVDGQWRLWRIGLRLLNIDRWPLGGHAGLQWPGCIRCKTGRLYCTWYLGMVIIGAEVRTYCDGRKGNTDVEKEGLGLYGY